MESALTYPPFHSQIGNPPNVGSDHIDRLPIAKTDLAFTEVSAFDESSYGRITTHSPLWPNSTVRPPSARGWVRTSTTQLPRLPDSCTERTRLDQSYQPVLGCRVRLTLVCDTASREVRPAPLRLCVNPAADSCSSQLVWSPTLERLSS